MHFKLVRGRPTLPVSFDLSCQLKNNVIPKLLNVFTYTMGRVRNIYTVARCDEILAGVAAY